MKHLRKSIREQELVSMPKSLSRAQTLQVFQYVIELKEIALNALVDVEDMNYEYSLQESLMVDIVKLNYDLDSEDYDLAFIKHGLY